jgi:hypothetical protein
MELLPAMLAALALLAARDAGVAAPDAGPVSSTDAGSRTRTDDAAIIKDLDLLQQLDLLRNLDVLE